MAIVKATVKKIQYRNEDKQRRGLHYIEQISYLSGALGIKVYSFLSHSGVTYYGLEDTSDLSNWCSATSMVTKLARKISLKSGVK